MDKRPSIGEILKPVNNDLIIYISQTVYMVMSVEVVYVLSGSYYMRFDQLPVMSAMLSNTCSCCLQSLGGGESSVLSSGRTKAPRLQMFRL